MNDGIKLLEQFMGAAKDLPIPKKRYSEAGYKQFRDAYQAMYVAYGAARDWFESPAGIAERVLASPDPDSLDVGTDEIRVLAKAYMEAVKNE